MPRRAIEHWTVNGVEVPVHIYTERRRDNRISINRDKVILRMPQLRAHILYGSYIQWGRQWLEQQIESKPNILDRFRVAEYKNGSKITTAYREYIMSMEITDRSTSTAKLNEDKIHYKISDQVSTIERSKIIQRLTANVIAKDSQDIVSDRVHELNDLHFNQPIKAVKIKNTRSIWGSCSNTGSINISVRTLFAPLDVQDYVYVHELAHLVELNHSDRYWRLVQKAMPDYQEKEKWLNAHGAYDFFKP